MFYYSGFEISTVGRSKSQIRLILTSETVPWAIGVYDLTGVGQIPSPPQTGGWGISQPNINPALAVKCQAELQEWLDNFNDILTDPEHLLSFIESDQHTGRDIIVDVTGVEEFALITNAPKIPMPYGAEISPIIAKVQLIWFDEVTKERQVPYEVEKQRTVMQTKQVPFWEAIFGE